MQYHRSYNEEAIASSCLNVATALTGAPHLQNRRAAPDINTLILFTLSAETACLLPTTSWLTFVHRRKALARAVKEIVLHEIESRIYEIRNFVNSRPNVRRILVRGSMPPCRLRRRKFWKFDYEMVHCILKYTVSQKNKTPNYWP